MYSYVTVSELLKVIWNCETGRGVRRPGDGERAGGVVAGLWCSQPQDDRNARPSIMQVLAVLRFELPLLSLLPARAPPVAWWSTRRRPAGLLTNSDPCSHGTNNTSAMSTSI